MMKKFGFWIGIVFLLIAGKSRADIHYVWGDNPDTPAPPFTNGWASAATRIQDAVDAAMPGDEVWVTNGVYALTNQVVISNAIAVIGVSGYSNTLVYADWPAYTTRCFYVANTGIVDGFTISNGHEFTTMGGAGIYATTNALIRNCFLVGNMQSNTTSNTGGGGICANKGSIVSDCRVVGNRVFVNWQAGAGILLKDDSQAYNCTSISNIGAPNGYGSGICGLGAASVISNCFVAFNSGQIGSGIQTAGLVTDCVVSNNSGPWAQVNAQVGTAVIRNTKILNSAGSTIGFACTYGNATAGPLLTNCVIDGNGGAGIWSSSGNSSIKIINCTITRNKGRGLYVVDNGTVLVDSCLIASNTSASAPGGAGIYMTRGQIRNCLIVSNQFTGATGNGGGVCMTNAALNTNVAFGLINCTIVDNYSAKEGGGVAAFGDSNYIANCVIATNYAAAAVYPDVYPAGIATDHFWYTCAIVTAAPLPAAQGNIAGDPRFVNADAADYRLRESSPCINKGTFMSWMTGSKDLAGHQRIIGAAVDMGAFEAPPPKGSLLSIK